GRLPLIVGEPQPAVEPQPKLVEPQPKLAPERIPAPVVAPAVRPVAPPVVPPPPPPRPVAAAPQRVDRTWPRWTSVVLPVAAGLALGALIFAVATRQTAPRVAQNVSKPPPRKATPSAPAPATAPEPRPPVAPL